MYTSPLPIVLFFVSTPPPRSLLFEAKLEPLRDLDPLQHILLLRPLPRILAQLLLPPLLLLLQLLLRNLQRQLVRGDLEVVPFLLLRGGELLLLLLLLLRVDESLGALGDGLA